MSITFMYNRNTNEIEDNGFEIGANFFADNNNSEDVYIFYGKHGKTFFISKDQGIIADVNMSTNGFEDLGDMEPIYLDDDEKYVIEYTLNTFDSYNRVLDDSIKDNTTISREQMLRAIMEKLEKLLYSKVINGEFERNLKEFLINAANKYNK